MFNKKNIFIILFLFGLIVIPARAYDLKQVDISKSSEDVIDVDLYTDSANSSPMVTRKANDKYVILLPNVKGKSTGTPDLSLIRDVVTNVDVKNVDDGMNGYTKITLTTTKPLAIRPHIKRTTPVSQEEKAAKMVIAQSKLLTSAKTAEVKVPVKTVVAPKTETKAVATKVQNEVKQKIVTEKPINSVREPKKEIIPEKTVVKDNIVQNIPAVKQDNTIQPTEKTTPEKANNNKIIFLLIPLLALLYLAKKSKQIFLKQNVSAKQEMNYANDETSEIISDNDYSEIINDKGLNWQGKYMKFIKNTRRQTSTDNKYMFVKSVESKVDENVQPVNVIAEEDAIITDKMNSVKLKSFTTPVNLSSSHRSKKISSNKKVNENRFLQLQQKMLDITKSERKFSVADLIETGNQYIEEKTVLNNDYSMSSIDEYFNLLDKEEILNKKKKQSINKKYVAPTTSNPIEKSNNSKDYLKGLIIKQSYNIDSEKGFYLVNSDGQNALVGKIGEEVFVLKKFNENVNHVQIREDKNNTYMVKADNFKSLVGVEKDKMGVLIEL